MSNTDRRELVAIFAGGAGGALLRVWLGRRFGVADGSWPWVTFSINITGSVLLAYFATRLQERLPVSTYRRPFLGTGFCGAYTTFSTMQVEIVTMLRAGRLGAALAYAVASLTAGYAAIWMTTALVRRSRLVI